MYLLFLLMIVGTVLIGINFIQVLVRRPTSSLNAEIAPVGRDEKSIPYERFSLGMTVLIFGALWILAWLYFLIAGWDSFRAQVGSLILHVVVQFITSVSLLIAGIAVLQQWKSWRRLYIASMVFLVVSVQVGVLLHGPSGHGEPLLMYLFAIWTFVVGGAFTMALYILDRFIHDWDRPSRVLSTGAATRGPSTLPPPRQI